MSTLLKNTLLRDKNPDIPAKVWLLLPALIIILLSPPLSADLSVNKSANNPRNQVGFYIESYGRIEPENSAQSALAHQIFQRIKGVASSSNRSLARLEVVNSPHDPWAISLPDGHIVLSKGAVDLCYELDNSKEACLAFILGHEMAHIANNDFWHQEVSRFLSTNEATSQQVTTNKVTTSKKSRFLASMNQRADNELKADDDGFIYAAMAGYPVEKLLHTNPEGNDFFHYWSQQTSAKMASRDPVLDVRANLLRERLTQISAKLVYFQFGVRLAHFDYCDDAVHFFANFQQAFPGREVLNNLGFCYLQIARQQMSPTRAYFYWLPLQLDGETRATALTQRGGKKPVKLKDMTIGPEQAALDRAVDYLKQAVNSDLYYLPARINLAVAYLYSNQPHNARAVLDEARALAPDNSDVQGLEALSIYEQSDSQINLLPNAVARLEKLLKGSDAPDSTLFNLVRLLQIGGSDTRAAPYLKRLNETSTRLPGPIVSALCEEFGSYEKTCPQKPLQPLAKVPWSWPLPTQEWQQLTPELKAVLSKWQRTRFDWGTQALQGTIYRQPDNNAEAIVIDQFIQMQIIKLQETIPLEKLQAHCQQILLKRQLPTGDVWSCGHWAALSVDQNVSELWWVSR